MRERRAGKKVKGKYDPLQRQEASILRSEECSIGDSAQGNLRHRRSTFRGSKSSEPRTHELVRLSQITGTYELINRHEVYRTKEVIRRAAFVSHQRNAILAFGYRAGGVGPEHRHHVNVLKTDEKGFLGCKHNRIRSYLWAHVTWASTSLDPEIVSEEWAIVAVITPSRRGASVTFTASEIGSAGALDLSTTDDVKTSGLLSSLFGGSKRG
jgi:hypothetical protein